MGACKGACCIEGDAGAPVELDEVMELEEVLPIIWDELAPEARAVIEKQGVVYTDEEGDEMPTILEDMDKKTLMFLIEKLELEVKAKVTTPPLRLDK